MRMLEKHATLVIFNGPKPVRQAVGINAVGLVLVMLRHRHMDLNIPRDCSAHQALSGRLSGICLAIWNTSQTH